MSLCIIFACFSYFSFHVWQHQCSISRILIIIFFSISQLTFLFVHNCLYLLTEHSIGMVSSDRQTDSIASFGGNGGRTWPRLTPLNRKKVLSFTQKKVAKKYANVEHCNQHDRWGHRRPSWPSILSSSSSNSNSKTNDHLIAVLSLQTVIFVSRFLFWWITSVVSLLLLCHTFASSISRKRERIVSFCHPRHDANR